MRAARVAVRRGRPDDLDALEALENKSFSSDQLSRRSLARYLRVASAALMVVETEAGLGGYALIGLRRGGRTASLYSICVDPDQGGRGLGKTLMAALEAEARAQGRDVVTLEVRADNAPAIALYDRLGYVRFGEIADYYEDGQSALRMRKTLG